MQIGGRMSAAEVVDAEGKLVLPGGVDMHVHFSPALVEEGDFRWADDFLSGSRAAAAGGVTTVGNITFPVRDEPLPDTLARTMPEADADSLADYVLHPVIVRPPADAEALVRGLAGYGCVSVKIFTHMAGFAADPARYVDVIAAASRHNLTVMAHCEDPALGQHLAGQAALQPTGTSKVYYPADNIEVAAVARMTEIARATGARIYLVHLSSGRSVDVAVAARARGADVSWKRGRNTSCSPTTSSRLHAARNPQQVPEVAPELTLSGSGGPFPPVISMRSVRITRPGGRCQSSCLRVAHPRCAAGFPAWRYLVPSS